MSNIRQLCFLNSNHLFVQDGMSWMVYEWPDMVVATRGKGTGFVDGNELIAVLEKNIFEIDDDFISIELPGNELVQSYACTSRTRVLIMAGKSALDKPRMPGPSLNPVPSEGATAERFGTYPDRGMSLWTFSVDGRELSHLLTASGIEEIRNPIYIDNFRVVYGVYHFPAYGEKPSSRLMVVDTRTRETEDFLQSIEGATTGFAFHSETSRGAFLHSEIHSSFPFWYRLVVRAADGAISYPIPETIRLTGASPVWSPSGEWLAVTAFDGIRIGVIRVHVPVNGGEMGSWDWVGTLEGVYRTIAVHNDGSVVAVRQIPGEIEDVVHLVGHNPPRVLISDSKGTNNRPKVIFQHAQWKNGKHALEGIYARPDGEGITLPLIVDLHGGPTNGLNYGAQPRLEEWCHRGFAAFAPDYRGSGILGLSEMMRVFHGDEGALEDECNDVITGVDHLIEQGLAQADNILLFGHSAGASLVNHMIARTNRFRAAVSWEGYPDEELSFYLGWGGGGIAFARHMYGGSPIEVPFVYRRQSATTYADRVKTPILLLHGDDCTAPAIKWFTVLREYGVEAELVFYRGEGHVMKLPENHRDIFGRSEQWFAKWLGSGH